MAGLADVRALSLALVAVVLGAVVALGIVASASAADAPDAHAASVDDPSWDWLRDDAMGFPSPPYPAHGVCQSVGGEVAATDHYPCLWIIDALGILGSKLDGLAEDTAALGVLRDDLADVKSLAEADAPKIAVLPAKLDAVEAAVTALGGKLDAIADAVEAQGPNVPGGSTANGASSDAPMYVQLASSDGTADLVETATVATREDLWFLAGLVVAGVLVAPVLRRVVLP